MVEKVETQRQLELKLDKKLSFKETLSQRLIYQRGIGILILNMPFINYSLQALYVTSATLH